MRDTFSLKIPLSYVINNESIKKELKDCRNRIGSPFKVILYNIDISKKDINNFIENEGDFLSHIDAHITSNKKTFGWFWISPNSKEFPGHNQYRYFYTGGISKGLEKYIFMVEHIRNRENKK